MNIFSMFFVGAALLQLLVAPAFCQNALVFTSYYGGEPHGMEGVLLDTCLCNSTTCTMETAATDPSDVSNFIVSDSYWWGDSCSGDADSVIVHAIPASAPGTTDCNTGIQLETFYNATISPYNIYNTLSASAVEFQYLSDSECETGETMYHKFIATTFFVCGGTSYQTVCDGTNMTITADSDNSYTETIYSDSSCSTILEEVTATVVANCLPVENDTYNDYDYSYTGVIIQGYSGGVSSDDDKYTVTKADYIGIIISAISIAFLVGVGLAYYYFKSAATHHKVILVSQELIS